MKGDDETPKTKGGETIKITGKKKKYTPKQLISTAQNREKAERLKKEIRHEHGIRTLYWNHTKNYSRLMQQEEENYVREKIKKYNISKFLDFFLERSYHFSLARKFIREYISHGQFNDQDRRKTDVRCVFKPTQECRLLPVPNYDLRIIDMDVKRTEEAIHDPVHAQKLTNILVNFSKRNSRIGYCQGLNFIASYFLKKLGDEEDTFWVMCYVIEESMPKEYYTNMLSVLADMHIVQILFRQKLPDLDKHFKKVGVGLEMVALPCFITLFTNCPSPLIDIIIDFFFLDGPIALIKAIILYFGYIKKKLLKTKEIGFLIKQINDEIRSEVPPVEPKEFFNDISKFYLSKFFVDWLRDHYTEKERKKLANQKKDNSTGIADCEPDWPICLYNIVKNSYYHKSPSFYIYRQDSIMGNFKPTHFTSGSKKSRKKILDRSSVRVTFGSPSWSGTGNQLLPQPTQTTEDAQDLKESENQLLIERTIHICKLGNEKMRTLELQKKRKNMMFKLNLAEGKNPTDNLGSPVKGKRRNSATTDSIHEALPVASPVSESPKKRDGSLRNIPVHVKSKEETIKDLKTFSITYQGNLQEVERPREDSSPPLLPQSIRESGMVFDRDEASRKNSYEIASDEEEEEDQIHSRDIHRRITLMKDQLEKFGVKDDLNFGEVYKSVIERNMAKFEGEK